jgi:hypothetical protein
LLAIGRCVGMLMTTSYHVDSPGGGAAAGLDLFQHSFERFQPISLQLLEPGVVTAIMPRP